MPFFSHPSRNLCHYVFFVLFFFQAEDGIRDLYVTGVQTCALPIYQISARACHVTTPVIRCSSTASIQTMATMMWMPVVRSEERRVGKECRSRWGAEQ